MVLVTLVKAWYARCAADEPGLAPESTPWHAKTRPSFADMLAALRRHGRTGRPWGRGDFLTRLGNRIGRSLVPGRPGRPRKERKGN